MSGILTAGNWRARASCLNYPADVFFPISEAKAGTAQVAEARRICAHCPVRNACLDWALEVQVSDGIFGGLTASERRQLIARAARA